MSSLQRDGITTLVGASARNISCARPKICWFAPSMYCGGMRPVLLGSSDHAIGGMLLFLCRARR